MQITDMAEEEKLTPLFRLAFRFFFLAGAVFSVLSMAVWAGFLSGEMVLQPYANMNWWHSHEMLFGFSSAIIVGFILTAVQNWTGIPGVKGKKLMFLAALWLIARLALLFPIEGMQWFIMALDISFLPVAAYFFALPLIKIKQYRNLFIVLILTLLSVANITTHLAYLLNQWSWLAYGNYLAIALICLLIVIIGGRVMPMFTANGTQTTKALPKPWLEKLSIGSVAAILILHLSTLIDVLPSIAVACVYLIAGVSNLVRLLRWRFWITFKVPLLWSLHFSYLCIPLGFFLMAAYYLGLSSDIASAVHLLTVGGVGGVILAMIARVSLGHTARTLQTVPVMSIAFIALLSAAFARSVMVLLLPQSSSVFYLVAAFFWCLAFTLFALVYFPVLTKARVDGRPG